MFRSQVGRRGKVPLIYIYGRIVYTCMAYDMKQVTNSSVEYRYRLANLTFMYVTGTAAPQDDNGGGLQTGKSARESVMS